jgi:hypothetical protein
MNMTMCGDGSDVGSVGLICCYSRKVDVKLIVQPGGLLCSEWVQVMIGGVSFNLFPPIDSPVTARALLASLVFAAQKAEMMYDTRNVPADGIELTGEPLPDDEPATGGIVPSGDFVPAYHIFQDPDANPVDVAESVLVDRKELQKGEHDPR